MPELKHVISDIINKKRKDMQAELHVSCNEVMTDRRLQVHTYTHICI